MKPIKHTLAALIAIAPLTAWATPQQGDTEFQLSGSGTSDKDFDANSIGVTGSYGWYLSDHSLWGLRQTINTYFDIDRESTLDLETDSDFSGSTSAFYDYHFGTGDTRPFVGVSLGATYGDAVKNTFYAGPELGVKHYVKDDAFVYGMMAYQFNFEDADRADDNFSDGSYVYSVGVGLNY